MAETMPTVADIKALAEQVHSEADAMRLKSDRAMRVYALVGIVLLVYLAWAFHRIANFIEPTNLATTTGDIAIGQAHDLIREMEQTGKEKAPELVGTVEREIVRSVPDFRLQLETQVRTTIGTIVKQALAESDKVMVEELAKLPDVGTRLASAASNPDEAAKLYEEVRKQMMAREDVKKSLAETMVEMNKLRDHMRKLKENRGLTPSEKAERRLLQVVLAKVELPPKPLTVVAEATKARPAKKGHR